MARVDVPITQVSLAGVTPAAQVTGDTVEGHKLASNDGRVFVEVENTDAAATHNATFLTPRTSGGVAIEDPAIVVAKSGKSLVGPFPPQTFNQSTGQLHINVNSALLKLRAFRV